MKNDDKWLEVLQHRLEDYPVKPSDDLWQKIEKELETSPAQSARIVPLWLKTVAAAAAVVLVGGASWMYFSRSLEVQNAGTQKTLLSNASSSANVPVQKGSVKESIPAHHTGLDKAAPSRPAVLMARVREVPAVPDDKEEYETAAVPAASTGDTVATASTLYNKELMASVSPESSSLATDTPKNKAPEADKPVAKEKPENWYDSLSDKDRTELAENTFSNRSSGNRWSVSLTAMNGLPSVGGNIGGGGGMVSMMSDAPANLHPFGNSLSDEYILMNRPMVSDKQATFRTSSSVKHKIPVSYGTVVRYNLTERWGLESGLSYTMLSSSFSNEGGENGSSYEQNLHYLEVPLRVSYTFVNQRWFSLYAVGGGAVAKCIYAKVDESEGQDYSLGEKPWQWSVSSAVGAQLNIVEHVGIYLEPGVGYYFNDNSSLRTVYKDHPWVFKLNFGFRLSY